MPNLAYAYVLGPGAPTCAGPTAVGLTLLPNPIVPTWPQLYAAQASIGVYPPGWAALEMRWRITSLRLSSQPAIMIPSPVIQQADPTEKAQLSYHLGMAAGIATGLQQLAPGAGAGFFPMLLTRAIANGAAFNFATPQRPDMLFFSLTLPAAGAPPVFNNLVVWECKGHAVNVGQAPLIPALNQSLSLTAMTALPGGAVLPMPVGPVSYVASQIDVVFGNYRLQIMDPDKPAAGRQTISVPDMNEFLKTFYMPYVEILSGPQKPVRKRYAKQTFLTWEIIPKIHLGLDEKLFKAVQKNGSNLSNEIGEILSSGYQNADPDRYWIMNYGLLIALENGWDEP